MSSETVTLQLSASLHSKLQELAIEAQTSPDDLSTTLVNAAYLQRSWLRDLTELREQIKRDGGLRVGTGQEEAVERLRQTRREIFDAK